MATRNEITNLVLALSKLPNCPIQSKDDISLVVEMWMIVLKDLDYELLDKAAREYLATETFFPAPGNLRQIALDLQLAASGIPTPAEAWANVQDAYQYIKPITCDSAQIINNTAINAKDTATYWDALDTAKRHAITCKVCKSGGFQEVYDHPLVAEVVRRLGGRERLLTDNPTADRARFIEAYREILDRERRNAGRVPEVQEYIEKKRTILLEAKNSAWDEESWATTGADKQLQMLAEGMRK